MKNLTDNRNGEKSGSLESAEISAQFLQMFWACVFMRNQFFWIYPYNFALRKFIFKVCNEEFLFGHNWEVFNVGDGRREEEANEEDDEEQLYYGFRLHLWRRERRIEKNKERRLKCWSLVVVCRGKKKTFSRGRTDGNRSLSLWRPSFSSLRSDRCIAACRYPAWSSKTLFLWFYGKATVSQTHHRYHPLLFVVPPLDELLHNLYLWTSCGYQGMSAHQWPKTEIGMKW